MRRWRVPSLGSFLIKITSEVQPNCPNPRHLCRFDDTECSRYPKRPRREFLACWLRRSALPAITIVLDQLVELVHLLNRLIVLV